MPGAEAVLQPAVWISSGRREDDVLSVPVGRRRRVTEVRSGVDRLDAKLMTSGGCWGCGALINPDARQRAAGRVSDVLGVGGRARLRADGYPVAVLGHDS